MQGLQQFLSFAETAKHGSFAAAARELGSAPSTLAKAVSRLEAALGVKLFHRTTRQVSLTPDGERLFHRCQRVLAEVDDLQAEAAGTRAAPSGSLRIDMPIVYGKRVLLPLLSRLLERHPALQLDVRLEDSYVDLVRDGFDMAVRVGSLRDSSLVARRFASQSLLLAASPAYLERHGTPRTIEQLSGHAATVFRQPSDKRLRPWQLRSRQAGRAASGVAGAAQRRRGHGRRRPPRPRHRAAAQLHGRRRDRRRAAGRAAALVPAAATADQRRLSLGPAGAAARARRARAVRYTARRRVSRFSP